MSCDLWRISYSSFSCAGKYFPCRGYSQREEHKFAPCDEPKLSDRLKSKLLDSAWFLVSSFFSSFPDYFLGLFWLTLKMENVWIFKFEVIDFLLLHTCPFCILYLKLNNAAPKSGGILNDEGKFSNVFIDSFCFQLWNHSYVDVKINQKKKTIDLNRCDFCFRLIHNYKII